ncbi:hypothetical protein K7X08_012184 [Anisodus acutangulus]|uniref:Uncharacterized protein n=1 Tax=Anisodus acutangulus TaxID=402998 RepID=A0A9Q1LB71_9SOLA|nr:hypothetical protein K7X08_012184 [Anisodus acutangulus]
MCSKKSGAQSDFQASGVNAMKKLLIADAKPMLISRIPESLKKAEWSFQVLSPLTMVLICLVCILCHMEMGCLFVVTSSIVCRTVEKVADEYKLSLIFFTLT